MATPDFIKFSRISGTPADAYRRLTAELFDHFGVERHSFAYLRRTDDPFYAGLVQHDELIPCDTMDQLIYLAEHDTLFGSMHLFPNVPGYIYFHVTDVDESGFTMTCSIDTGLVGWDDHRWERGHPDRWFKVMLTTLTAALRASVSGWGRGLRYYLKYESLSPESELALLRSGEMLQDDLFPIFHALSLDLISEKEVQALLKKHDIFSAPTGMEYEVSTAGYHLLYILP